MISQPTSIRAVINQQKSVLAHLLETVLLKGVAIRIRFQARNSQTPHYGHSRFHVPVAAEEEISI